MTSLYNPDLTDMLRPEFQARNERNFSLANTLSSMIAIPGLRGLWPMSVFDSAGDAKDINGTGKHLTYTGNPTYNFIGLKPYIDFDGTGDYLTRADEADLDIIGNETFVAGIRQGVSLGGWFEFDTLPAFSTLIGKREAAANFSYWLEVTAAGAVSFFVSNTGVLAVSQLSSTTLTTGVWYHIVGTYEPSTSINIWVDGILDTNTTGVPATLFNGVAPFNIGAGGAAGFNPMDGKASMCFLSSMFLDSIVTRNMWYQQRVLFKNS